MSKTAMYDPAKTFDDNTDNGPFPDNDESTYLNSTGEPQYAFLGYKLYSPFGIPAGPLPSAKHVKYAFDKGFDVVVYKTQRSQEFPCNAFPNILYVDTDGDLTLEKASKPLIGHTETSQPADKLSITNSFGVPSRGPGYWVDDFKKAKMAQGKGQLLIMSVVGTIREGFGAEDYYNDFVEVAGMAADAGAEVIEINLSCPNVASEGVLCYTHGAVVEICKHVKERIGSIPLIIKVGYYSNEQQDLLERIVRDVSPYVAGIAAINTIAAPIVDENGEQALPGPNRLKSGVCGAGIKWAGLDMVRRLKALRDKLNLNFSIVGVGGVMTPNDFKEYRDAGADVVQSATGAMWNSNLAAEIKASL